MQIVSARNPKATELGGIDLYVTFQEIGEVPFHATPADKETHGVELYQRAVNGDFGPVVPYTPPTLSSKEVERAEMLIYETAVTDMLNAEAFKKGYRDMNGVGDIKSAALRAGYAGPFHDEGVAYATWMDGCWAACYQALGEYRAGTIPKPTVEALLLRMPTLVLP